MQIYRVWEEWNHGLHDGSREYAALDVQCAAQIHAQRFDRDDPVATWPRPFIVIDPNGVWHRVQVDRVIEYAYRGAEPELLVQWFRRDASFNKTGKPSSKNLALHRPHPQEPGMALCAPSGPRRIVLFEDDPISDPPANARCHRCLTNKRPKELR